MSGDHHGQDAAREPWWRARRRGRYGRILLTRVRQAGEVARDGPLRRFWISQMVSEIGDWVGLLGVAALLYQATGRALAASAALAAMYLPYVFAPWLAAAGARIPPRTLLVGADLLRGALLLMLLLPLPPWGLLLLVFLTGLPTSVYEATRAAAAPAYAPDAETRDDALVLFQSTQQIAVMVGFLTGGIALAYFSVQTAIVINALSFLVSALLILGVPALPAFANVEESARALMKAGARALRGQRLLRRAMILSIVSASTIMAGEALVVVYGATIDHQGLAGPFAATSAAVGAVLGIVLPRHVSSRDLLRVAEITMAVGAVVALVAFGFGANPWLGFLGYVGLGVINAPGVLTYVVAVREMGPAVRAPVFAIAQVGMMGGQALVAVAAGHTADRLNVAASIALWQLPTLLLALWWLAWSWRARPSPASTPGAHFPRRWLPRPAERRVSGPVDEHGTPELPTTR